MSLVEFDLDSPADIKRSLDEWVEIAEGLMDANGGVLPSAAEISKLGLRRLWYRINKYPEYFGHIRRKRRTPPNTPDMPEISPFYDELSDVVGIREEWKDYAEILHRYSGVDAWFDRHKHSDLESISLSPVMVEEDYIPPGRETMLWHNYLNSNEFKDGIRVRSGLTDMEIASYRSMFQHVWTGDSVTSEKDIKIKVAIDEKDRIAANKAKALYRAEQKKELLLAREATKLAGQKSKQERALEKDRNTEARAIAKRERVEDLQRGKEERERNKYFVRQWVLGPSMSSATGAYKKTLEAAVKVAEKIALSEGGLPVESRLKITFGWIVRLMKQHPEQFWHIPRKSKAISPSKLIDEEVEAERDTAEWDKLLDKVNKKEARDRANKAREEFLEEKAEIARTEYRYKKQTNINTIKETTTHKEVKPSYKSRSSTKIENKPPDKKPYPALIVAKMRHDLLIKRFNGSLPSKEWMIDNGFADVINMLKIRPE